MAEKSPRKRA